MKIAITTDTHYGHDHRTHKIHEKFLKDLKNSCDENRVDAVIHSGDWISCNQHQLPRTFKMFRDALGDLPILGVLGNHDFWDFDYWGVPIAKRRWAKHPAGMSHAHMVLQHMEWAKDYNIHLLQKNPFRFDAFGSNDTVIMGYNGWYNDPMPMTNDSKYMASMYESCPLGVYLKNEAYKNLFWCLDEVDCVKSENKNVKKVLVTHMPYHSKNKKYLNFCANPRYLDFVSEKFDCLIVGHSHQTEDFIHTCEISRDSCDKIEKNDIRIVNAGTYFDNISGGYNKPKFLIIDI
jgi:predicted phosphodiesterase